MTDQAVTGAWGGAPFKPALLPGWAEALALAGLSIAAALALSAALIAGLGENPVDALGVLFWGAFGYGEAVGYTLYYATNYIFTGLAVAIAFQCGLFNIGAEGQAYLGGLGVALVILALGEVAWPVAALAGILAGAAFGAVWGVIPGALQAYRGSHVVITTIMFNFIATSLMTWLLVDVLIRPGQQAPESLPFAPSTWLPTIDRMAAWVGAELPPSPANLTVFLALVCCLGYWLFVWHTHWGYGLRTVGGSERAAVYAGISPGRMIVLAMALSGGLAGLVAVNDLLGVHHRLILDFPGGAGFVGIAVALIGRAHPGGIVLAAVLFGALQQGGSELAFEYPGIDADLVVVVQGLVILFAGALENLFRPWLRRRRPGRQG